MIEEIKAPESDKSAPSGRVHPLVGLWRPMREAPKDGTFIKVLVYHPQRRYAKKSKKHEWEQVVEARWSTFNAGGWVWSGMFGRFQKWRPNVPALAQSGGEKTSAEKSNS